MNLIKRLKLYWNRTKKIYVKLNYGLLINQDINHKKIENYNQLTFINIWVQKNIKALIIIK